MSWYIYSSINWPKLFQFYVILCFVLLVTELFSHFSAEGTISIQTQLVLLISMNCVAPLQWVLFRTPTAHLSPLVVHLHMNWGIYSAVIMIPVSVSMYACMVWPACTLEAIHTEFFVVSGIYIVCLRDIQLTFDQ